MSQTVLQPQETDYDAGNGRWMVVIYNNETNSFDEVIDVLMDATGCDAEEAAIEAWEADHYGKAPVHFAAKDECEATAGTISKIGVKTEVAREWMD
ncbi:ATP-dependent Clp protease adaptor ClpS [Fimbriimonas ginsengisoli]|uniref:ATP-dependent Clp protease adaptor protein ClpS n=1 Tax=Fimbriimonas ginsengisoli Gsoil 348 TaxID=661478 RepID=A0A068NJD9_FIMGI|nr:ATP-dependent Clp protease adaptor ClpS [Fimbriimonas ginsengisoli]AIE83606.1 ATP-dependent Clp protease adaptor protein ClpS [Fimbriimonas ginsengisoli Gsoil 348]